MVTTRPFQKFTRDRPMPIDTAGKEGVLPVVAIAGMDELLEYLKLINHHLGAINNDNYLEPGDLE